MIIQFRKQLDVTRRCLDRLLTVTECKNFQVVLVDNWSSNREAAVFAVKAQKHDRVRIIRVEEPFNYSRLNDIACLQSISEYFVLMNNNIFIKQSNWPRLLVDVAPADSALRSWR